jgi:hypothetical protein
MEELLLIDNFSSCILITNARKKGRTDVLGSLAYFVNKMQLDILLEQ